MASPCVLVSGLDSTVNCSEMRSLFESAGPVSQLVTLSPAADGSPSSVLVFFADAAAASEAVDLFDSHPYAGCFLEVRPTDAAAAAQLQAALKAVQTAAPGSTPQAPLAAPASAPLVSFPSGAAVPMPAPFSASAAKEAAAPGALAAPAASPEPPQFDDYNPEEWEPAPAAPAAGWPAAAGARKPQPAPAKTAKTAKPAAAPAAPAGVPEWEVDRRCRIFVQNLRAGLTADDLRAYFSKFGKIVDASVVPIKRIGFLTFFKGDDGEAALNACNGCSIPNLSPSGSEPLKMEHRDLDKIRSHMSKATSRPDVVSQPTTRLFIGYFPRSTKRRDVELELSRYGDVVECMLGGGSDGGELYCFASYRRVHDAASAQKAIHGKALPTLAGARAMLCVFKEPRRSA